MELTEVDALLDKNKVYRKNAECVVELLQLYRRLPRGEMRNVICTTMNELSSAMVDLQYYLRDGVLSDSLREAVGRQPGGEPVL